jgi:DNA-binding response OmpR family regulator
LSGPSLGSGEAPRRILVVEDDDAIATALSLNLRLAGHDVDVAEEGTGALTAIDNVSYDLVLLDINLPGRNGLEVLADMRRGAHHVPVIVVSAREGEFDKVAALRLGADDYVTKPFGLAELLARIDAVLRRATLVGGASAAAATPIAVLSSRASFADVSIDFATRLVMRGGTEVKLTHLEFELLRYFLQNPSQVFNRTDLLHNVWGQQSGSPRTVDNFVGQLRSKLERDADNPVHFVTVRGSGYRFDP